MPLRHAGSTTPSTWVTRFAPLIAAGGEVLDLACGSGRHARWLVSRGFRVEAADRDAVALELPLGSSGLVTLAGVDVVQTSASGGFALTHQDF